MNKFSARIKIQISKFIEQFDLLVKFNSIDNWTRLKNIKTSIKQNRSEICEIFVHN